jgi:protein-S-isoprenylcysteine O-methyltransferase Ste14
VPDLFLRITVWLAALAIGLVRLAHSARKIRHPAKITRGGARDYIATTASVIGFLMPLVWATFPWLRRADYPSHPAAAVAGAVTIAFSLWLFHRTHVDIGSNWSASLQVTERQELITTGVYSRVRHPMYSSLLLFAAGMVLLVPNWIAGPAALAGQALLAGLRMGPEEAMMRQAFGTAYDDYRRRTRRLLPGGRGPGSS